MVKNLKNILCNLAAISIAAITVLNLQRDAPITNTHHEWDRYMNSYLMIMMAATAGMYFVLLVNNKAKLVTRSVIFCAIILLISVGKCLNNKFDYNAFWDYGAIGVVAIFCFFRITLFYIKKLISLLKTIINQTYLKWPYRPRKK